MISTFLDLEVHGLYFTNASSYCWLIVTFLDHLQKSLIKKKIITNYLNESQRISNNGVYMFSSQDGANGSSENGKGGPITFLIDMVTQLEYDVYELHEFCPIVCSCSINLCTFSTATRDTWDEKIFFTRRIFLQTNQVLKIRFCDLMKRMYSTLYVCLNNSLDRTSVPKHPNHLTLFDFFSPNIHECSCILTTYPYKIAT